MSVHHLTIVAVLAGLAVNPSVLAQQPAPATRVADAARTLASDAEILAIIKQRVDEKRSAGIVVGVIDADGRSRVVAYGDPGPGKPPLDANSVFEIGSISKVFTSTVRLLGHILSLVTNMSYEDMERQRVWAPLGMTNTAITFTPWMTSHLALGHDEQGRVVSNWDIPALAGAGVIRSTTSDMLKFLDANLHPERGALGRAMALAHEERARAGNMMIGLNWHMLHAGADTIVWHNGGTGGYRTFIGFEPSRKTGVVVMTNTGGAGADDIGFHLLDPALPLAPPPAPPKQRTAIELPNDVLARYVGSYQLAPNFILEVTLKDGALWVHPTNQQVFRLWPESETSFFLKEVDAQLSFVRDAQGAVTAAVLHQNGQDAAAPRVRTGG
jgi:CubicO group peptidase (beta-lactamase class C family)